MSNNPATVADIFALEADLPIDFTVPAFGLDLELPLIDFELPDVDLELPAEGVKR
jgi:hypothetical protein